MVVDRACMPRSSRAGGDTRAAPPRGPPSSLAPGQTTALADETAGECGRAQRPRNRRRACPGAARSWPAARVRDGSCLTEEVVMSRAVIDALNAAFVQGVEER